MYSGDDYFISYILIFRVMSRYYSSEKVVWRQWTGFLREITSVRYKANSLIHSLPFSKLLINFSLANTHKCLLCARYRLQESQVHWLIETESTYCQGSCCLVALLLFLSKVQHFVTPWAVAHQAPLSSTISCSLPRFMSTELVLLSNHFILCHPLRLLPSVFPSIRVFSSELALRLRRAA